MFSITHGEVSFDEMCQLIKMYTSQDPNAEFKIAIGTDSQNFSYTKIPVTIGIHKIVNNVGCGGIFFAEIKRVPKISNMKQKLFYETNLSLKYAFKLKQILDQEEIPKQISVHIDAGYNGPSSQFIDDLTGWVKSCGFESVVKPDSYMASSVANRLSK